MCYDVQQVRSRDQRNLKTGTDGGRECIDPWHEQRQGKATVSYQHHHVSDANLS